MIHRTSLARRVSAVVFIGGLLTAAGCGNLLGFQDAAMVQCILNSDCPTDSNLFCIDGFCSPDCRTDRDCPSERHPLGTVCELGTCMPGRPSVSDAEASVAPTGPEGGLDGAQGHDSQADAASDAGEGGECASACSEFSMCYEGACLAPTPFGYPATVGPRVAIGENGYFQAIQLNLSLCGYVTGIGFVLAAADGEPYRFGLYTDDGGGNPHQLIAETAPGVVHQGVNEAPVTSPTRIGCEDTSGYYWVIGTVDQNSVEFVAESTPATKWISAKVNPADGDPVANDLPSIFPSEGTLLPSFFQPHVYVIVAQL